MKEFSQYDLPASNDFSLNIRPNAICVSPVTGEITPALNKVDYKWGRQVTTIKPGEYSVTQPPQGETFYVYIDAARSITDGSGGGQWITLPDGTVMTTQIVPLHDKTAKDPKKP